MTQVKVDAKLRSLLHGLTQKVELISESGEVLGHVIPRQPKDTVRSEEPRITPAEIARRRQRRGGRQLAEILADLEDRA